MTEKLVKYYAGDEFAAGVWLGKYATKDKDVYQEETPDDMHIRMAQEFWRVERDKKILPINDVDYNALSTYGKELVSAGFSYDQILNLFKDYKYVIPQGSIMTMLGNKYKIGSLSNCFVIPAPLDSYGGIMKNDEYLVQLMKRRGGVGQNLNPLRPNNAPVSNAAGSSTGILSWMNRYSNTTREVAQNGRRGALMLLLSCLHPEIFDFVKSKADLTKVTGANISVMLTEDFMKAVEADADFLCKFPIESNISQKNAEIIMKEIDYNKISEIRVGISVMKIHAKELFDLIIKMAHSNGEPGLAFMDSIHNYSPDGVYDLYRAVASNPCGEQWMQAFDACRLLALNFFSVVQNPYTEKAYINYDLLYRISYLQQKLADMIVDLEIEYVQRIIDKIKSDPEPMEIKATELNLWEQIKITASNSRRTGCGFTALADMLAALNLKYDSDEAILVIEKVCSMKMRAELDCSIDLAILTSPFHGWDKNLEFNMEGGSPIQGKNKFFQMLLDEFPEQTEKMCKYGRKNVSWSTVAPTGTVSIVAKLLKYANTSAGVEPVFFPWYFRNKKVNPGEGVRVDFVDQNGDAWTKYPVIMGGFKEWYDINISTTDLIESLTEEELQTVFEKSPYYNACASDISWEKRIEIQRIVQKYTTNAISSTLNLPADTTKETVKEIYFAAWKAGLKGVTIYRDGCRTGVLVKEDKKEGPTFLYKDSVKRPKEIPSELFITSVKGVKYGVVVGSIDNNPYEIFAFNLPEEVKNGVTGLTSKEKKGEYSFISKDGNMRNIQIAAIHKDEQMLTRLVSGMLRHGVKPQYVMEQIDKCNLEVISFGKALSRILKKFVKEEDLINRAKCPDCESTNLRMQEGCLTCNSCGSSKCG